MIEQFRWGILGTGGITVRVAPGFQDARHKIAIVGSRDPERGRAHASNIGAERSGSYDDVLAADDIDAVYISLPNSLHLPWTIRAAEAGKHVLCEKPMATTPADCRTMTEACEKHGVRLAEAFMYRHHPRWAVVRRIIEIGEIGRLLTVKARFGYLQDRAGDVRLSPELEGGSIQDVGCYAVNVVRWFLGEPDQVLGAAIDRRGIGVDTHAGAVLRYANGTIGIVECSFDGPMGQSVEFLGEKGRIEVPFAFLPRGDEPVIVTTSDGERSEIVPLANQFGRQFLAFEAFVRQGEPMLTTPQDAEATQVVIAAWRAGG